MGLAASEKRKSSGQHEVELEFVEARHKRTGRPTLE
jgi:hypothetical protein